MRYTVPDMKRAPTNREIADILREIGLIDEAEDVPYKPQAYELAADVVDGLGEQLSDLYKRCGTKCIDDLPDIGESMTAKIKELVTTGRLKAYDRLKKKYPMDILAISSVKGVGPKTAVTLYKTLKVKTLKDLERVAKAGKIRKIPGFGRKSEDNILHGIGFLRQHEGRFRLHDLLPLANEIVERLKKLPGVTHVDVTGSIRRRKETIGDIDLVMTTSKPKLALDTFTTLPEVQEVTMHVEVARWFTMRPIFLRPHVDGERNAFVCGAPRQRHVAERGRSPLVPDQFDRGAQRQVGQIGRTEYVDMSVITEWAQRQREQGGHIQAFVVACQYGERLAPPSRLIRNPIGRVGHDQVHRVARQRRQHLAAIAVVEGDAARLVVRLNQYHRSRDSAATIGQARCSYSSARARNEATFCERRKVWLSGAMS